MKLMIYSKSSLRFTVFCFLLLFSFGGIICSKLAFGNDSAQPMYKPDPSELSKVRNAPIAFTYKPSEGSLDDQSQARLDNMNRTATIQQHGRSGSNSTAGLYAVAAVLLLIAGLISWRRARSIQ